MIVSVGWLGAVAAFIPLALMGVTSDRADLVSAAYRMMLPITWYVLIPFAIGSVLTGLVSALGTRWGLVRHYWVLTKLVLTVVAVAVLLLKVRPVEMLAARAEGGFMLGDALLRTRQSMVLHALGGFVVLAVNTFLGVVKPWGRTYFGRSRRSTGVADVAPSGNGGRLHLSLLHKLTPRHVMLVVGLILLVVLVVLHIAAGGASLH